MKHRSRTNLGFKISVILLVFFTVLAIAFPCVIKYLYHKMDYAPLSETIEYREGLKPVDNETYLSKTRWAGSASTPYLEYSNGRVTLNGNGHEDAYLVYVYTGATEFNYYSHTLWEKLVEVGRQYPEINIYNGFNRTYDGYLQLERKGWYTVCVMWADAEGRKYVFAQNFNQEQESSQTDIYNQWKTNKDNIRSTDGVTNYLTIGVNRLENGVDFDFTNAAVVLSVNKTTKEILSTFLLKETSVYIPGVGCGRLVDSYNYGGLELLIKTIEENFGVKIDNYLLYDCRIFERLVDAIGGIDITPDARQIEYINNYLTNYYRDYQLDGVENEYLPEENAQSVTLNGIQTFAYVSYKDTGLLDRNVRYKEIIRKIRENITLTKIVPLAETVLPYISTDVSYDEFLSLGKSALDIANYRFCFQSIPEESRVGEFEVGSQYVTVSTTQEETADVIGRAIKQGDFDKTDMVFTKIVWIAFISVTVLLIALILISFVRKYKILYYDENGKRIRDKEKTYRFLQKAHVYSQSFDEETVVEMYADKKMTTNLAKEFKMPMRNVSVYVKRKAKEREKTNI